MRVSTQHRGIVSGSGQLMENRVGVPHCAFEYKEPVTGKVIPRESIEVRALVFDAQEDLVLDSVAVSRRHGPKATYQQQPPANV